MPAKNSAALNVFFPFSPVQSKGDSGVSQPFQCQFVAGADLMVLEETPDPGPASEESARLARLRVRANIRLDSFVEAIENYFDRMDFAVSRFLRRSDAIGWEEIVVAANVKMTLGQIARSDLQEAHFDPSPRPGP